MLSLIQEIELRIAELQAQEPMDVAQFEVMKMRPNCSQFDPTIFEDDDFSWDV